MSPGLGQTDAAAGRQHLATAGIFLHEHVTFVPEQQNIPISYLQKLSFVTKVSWASDSGNCLRSRYPREGFVPLLRPTCCTC